MKSIIKILLSGIIIVVFWSCSHHTGTIRIGVLNGPSAVSFLQLMNQSSDFDGKKIKIILKNEPLQIQALMMQHKVDFAILPTIMAANLYNKGLDFRMVGCPVWGTLYLMTNDATKDTINQLAHQSVYVFGQGGTADILIQRFLKQKKVGPVKIEYSLNSNNELTQALLQRKIKFAIVSEPLVSLLLTKDSSIKIVQKLTCESYFDNFNKNIFVQTAFLVSSRFSDKYPSLVNQISDAYANSCNFVNEHPDSTAHLMLSNLLSPNINAARASIPLCNIHYIAAFALQQEVFRYLNIFYNFNPKSIGGKMPDQNFIYQVY